jgi:radical SAM superfamily enzyme YgiQ (UPF0313 family)
MVLKTILLLGINARFTHINLALYYLKAYVNTQKYKAVVLEKNINDYAWDVINEITDVNPDVLCLSCYIWNQAHIKAILTDIKKINKDLIIVCGGPDVSFNSEDWLIAYPSIDFIIQGAGEKAFYYLQDNDFTHTSKIIYTESYPLAEIHLPYNLQDKDSFKHRYFYYEASRGCAFNCSYCISSIEANKSPIQFKHIDTIKADIIYLLQVNPIIIKFIDRSFNINNDLCIEIWDFIRTLETETIFHFEIHPHILTGNQIDMLSSTPANRLQLEVGIQTIHDKTLSLINRTGSWDVIKSNLIKLTKLKNIHQHLDMIAGLPLETLSDIKATFNEIIKLKPDHFQLGFLKILPGTQISHETELYAYKHQATAPYRVFSNSTLSSHDMKQIETAELAIELIYNSHIMPNFSRVVINTNVTQLFDYYHSLGTYFKQNNITKQHKDKAKIFKATKEHMLNSFSLINSIGQKLNDSIIYDWFLLSTTHFYPDFLQASHCDEFKAQIYDSFKSLWYRLNTSNTKLKNTIFYKPITQEIIPEYIGAVKVERDGIYLIKEAPFTITKYK